MAEKTNIAWCDHTFNAWIGCTKVGPGCDHCYAEALDKRHRWGGGVHWGAGVPRYRTSESNWKEPIRWNSNAGAAGVRPRVFCASLADVFDNEVPREWRYDLWRLIEATPNLSWLLVTKRVGNVIGMVPVNWEKQFPDNVRLLITVCNQEEANRDIPKLLALPCKNGISYEPALGPVDWARWLPPMWRGQHDGSYGTDHHSLEWLIVGGESTQGAGKARPFVLGWGKDTIRQCRAASVPVFFKQAGSNATNREGVSHPFKDRAGADPAEWPEDLRVQCFPDRGEG